LRSFVQVRTESQETKLTKKQKLDHVAFARTCQHWTIADWKRVLWSDETKVNRLGVDGIRWVWVHDGEQLDEQMILETANFGGGSLMFWGCMGYKGTGYGCQLDATLNKELYLEILQDEMTHSLEHLGLEPGKVVFQQDNASAHKAKVCLKWLDDQGIEVMGWPPNSPDLNPIENLWAELKRRLGTYESPPGGMLELWDRVQTEWDAFSPEYCQRLVESMPQCMAMVLRNKGCSIKY
jgi:transposase